MTKRLVKIEVGLIRADIAFPHCRPVVEFDDAALIASTPYVPLEMDIALWTDRARKYYCNCIGKKVELELSQIVYFYDDHSQITRK